MRANFEFLDLHDAANINGEYGRTCVAFYAIGPAVLEANIKMEVQAQGVDGRVWRVESVGEEETNRKSGDGVALPPTCA